MTTYTDAELEGLMLLRQSFSWKVGVEQRAGSGSPATAAGASGETIRSASSTPYCLTPRPASGTAAAAASEQRRPRKRLYLLPGAISTGTATTHQQTERAHEITSRTPARLLRRHLSGVHRPGAHRTPRAGRLARAGRLPAAVIDDAKLAASELAANAVLYSASRGTSFTVRCEIGSGYVRIEVKDMGGPWRPRKPDGRPPRARPHRSTGQALATGETARRRTPDRLGTAATGTAVTGSKARPGRPSDTGSTGAKRRASRLTSSASRQRLDGSDRVPARGPGQAQPGRLTLRWRGVRRAR